MATFLLIGIGIAGMLGNVASAGTAGLNSIDKLQDQIKKVQEQNTNYNQQYAGITGNINTMSADIQAAFAKTAQQYIDLIDALKYANDEYEESFKRIQLAGLIIIIVVFFLLLLKQFGLLDLIAYYIDLPFVMLWNKITNKQ